MLFLDSQSQNPQSSKHKANSYARGERLGDLVQKSLEGLYSPVRLYPAYHSKNGTQSRLQGPSLVYFPLLQPPFLCFPLFCFSFRSHVSFLLPFPSSLYYFLYITYVDKNHYQLKTYSS